MPLPILGDDSTCIMEEWFVGASQLLLASYSGKGVTDLFSTQTYEDFMYLKAVWLQIKPRLLHPNVLWSRIIFDSFITWKDFKQHPNSISPILFGWIDHHTRYFQSNLADFNISDSSSYLDLAPLWKQSGRTGFDEAKKDGKVKHGWFCEKHILAFPQSCWCFVHHVQPFPQLCDGAAHATRREW